MSRSLDARVMASLILSNTKTLLLFGILTLESRREANGTRIGIPLGYCHGNSGQSTADGVMPLIPLLII
jgi:hypothetical protein